MVDREKFEALFREMGVGYEVHDTLYTVRPAKVQGMTIAEYKAQSRREPRTLLTVAQTHFHFTPEGVYLGAEADEMGSFTPRSTETT